MTPGTSVVNFTPSSTAAASGSSEFAGIADGVQMLHGQFSEASELTVTLMPVLTGFEVAAVVDVALERMFTVAGCAGRPGVAPRCSPARAMPGQSTVD